MLINPEAVMDDPDEPQACPTCGKPTNDECGCIVLIAVHGSHGACGGEDGKEEVEG